MLALNIHIVRLGTARPPDIDDQECPRFSEAHSVLLSHNRLNCSWRLACPMCFCRPSEQHLKASAICERKEMNSHTPGSQPGCMAMFRPYARPDWCLDMMPAGGRMPGASCSSKCGSSQGSKGTAFCSTHHHVLHQAADRLPPAHQPDDMAQCKVVIASSAELSCQIHGQMKSLPSCSCLFVRLSQASKSVASSTCLLDC